MIVDKIENSGLYSQSGTRIARAFQYLHTTDFSKLAAGKYEIESDDIFAIVSEYETKDIQDCALEAHRKYIDIQYLLEGSELIGVTSLKKQIASKAYSEEDDYALYADHSSLLELEAGRFAIFFPEDLHMPGVKNKQKAQVRKVIIKVRV
jgi:YhcH/YjgK/YiaL family protein